VIDGAVTPPIRALVVDDEALARKTLRILLSADPEVTCIGESASGADAIARVRRDDPDLVFLDVQMPAGGGFDVLQSLGDARRAEVVLVTAHDAHALRAFEFSALDYLLKPFDDERFHRTLKRAKERIRQTRVEALVRRLSGMVTPSPSGAGSDVPRDRIVVRSAGRVMPIDVSAIDYIEAEDYYVQLHVGGRSHLHREPMRDLESKLPPNFVRIHRSTIVNAHRVEELRAHPGGDYAVILRDGTELRLSRARRDRLEALLAGR
jgi:two-component system LytT family response regulator